MKRIAARTPSRVSASAPPLGGMAPIPPIALSVAFSTPFASRASQAGT